MIKSTLLGLFFGTFGTTLGGIIGCTFKKISNRFLSFILSFASGLMMSIICFELIPESLRISNSNMLYVIFGILLGIICMIYCDLIVQKKFSFNSKYNGNSILKTGIIVSIGIALHNLPEGLAIGSGFGESFELGISLAIAICFHDIPERNIYGSANEKWWNENIKNNILCSFIRNNNWNRSFFRCNYL